MEGNQPTSTTTRRDFVTLLATGGSALTLSLLTGGCESLKKAIENRPRRRCIVAGDPLVAQDLEYYAAAVAAMKALPNSDPRNWTAQAQIHLCDVEPIGGIHQRANALVTCVTQLVRHQNAVALLSPPAHSTAKLMYLGQSEPLRILDHHH